MMHQCCLEILALCAVRSSKQLHRAVFTISEKISFDKIQPLMK